MHNFNTVFIVQEHRLVHCFDTDKYDNLIKIDNMVLSLGIVLTYGCKQSMNICSHVPIFLNYFLSFSFMYVID